MPNHVASRVRCFKSSVQRYGHMLSQVEVRSARALGLERCMLSGTLQIDIRCTNTTQYVVHAGNTRA